MPDYRRTVPPLCRVVPPKPDTDGTRLLRLSRATHGICGKPRTSRTRNFAPAIAGPRQPDYKDTMHANNARTTAAVLCLAALGAATVAAACTGDPLRYQFAVGDQLTYERRVQVTTLGDGPPLTRIVDQIQVWCLSRQGDESLLLIDLLRAVNEQAQPATGVLVYVEDCGRRRLPDVMPPRIAESDDLLAVVPVLRQTLQDQPRWLTDEDLHGRRWWCALNGHNEQSGGLLRVDYTAEHPYRTGEILGLSDSGRFWFDPKQGVIARVESRREERSADRRTESITVLRRREHRAAGWTARRAKEAEAYLRTLRHEDRLLDEIVSQPDQVEQKLTSLGRLWEARLSGLDPRANSPFERLIRARPAQLTGQTTRLRAQAAYARRWLGRPAAPWSLQTPTGQTLTSEQVRDGVTVECLWSSQSPGFAATLAALDAALAQLAGRQVRGAALNLDANIQHARRLIEKLPAELTHVLGESLRAVDQPPELPLVRVLDRQGVVRRLWFGWRASYADVVAEALRWAKETSDSAGP